MADARITRDRHRGRIYHTLESRDGAVARDMYAKALRVQAAARGFCGKRTGHLASRIEVKPYQKRGGGWGMHVGVWTVRYAGFHHDGNFHRQGEFIRPTRAVGRNGRPPALRFVIGGRVIYRAKVRSYRGSKYLTRAIPFARD
jgi:hypothetical protein